jgi:hypothetical protein
MAKLRSSIRCSYISYTCTTQNIPAHGIRVLPMSSIATIDPYIDQLATTTFRWGLYSNHWAPWMLHYPWRPPQLTHPLLHHMMTNPPSSLSGSNTSANWFKIFYKSLIPSTNNTMINIGCHISLRCETKFGCICRTNALQGPIGSSAHSVMGHTPQPRLWVTIILSPTFPPSLVCI